MYHRKDCLTFIKRPLPERLVTVMYKRRFQTSWPVALYAFLVAVLVASIAIVAPSTAVAQTTGEPGERVTLTDANGNKLSYSLRRMATGTGHGGGDKCFLNSVTSPDHPYPDDTPEDDVVCSGDTVRYRLDWSIDTGDSPMSITGAWSVHPGVSNGLTIPLTPGTGSGTLSSGTINPNVQESGYTEWVGRYTADSINSPEPPLALTMTSGNTAVTAVADKGVTVTAVHNWELINNGQRYAGPIQKDGVEYLTFSPSKSLRRVYVPGSSQTKGYLSDYHNWDEEIRYTIYPGTMPGAEFSQIKYMVNGGPLQDLVDGTVVAKYSDQVEFLSPSSIMASKLYHKIDAIGQWADSNGTPAFAGGTEYGSEYSCSTPKPQSEIDAGSQVGINDEFVRGNNNCGFTVLELRKGINFSKKNLWGMKDYSGERLSRSPRPSALS